MKLSMTGVIEQSMWLKTNRRNNPINPFYRFNFHGDYKIIINSSSNAETQRYLQVLLLVFKKYSQAVDPA